MNNGEGITMNLTEQSPAQVDGALFPLLDRIAHLEMRILRERKTIKDYEAKGQPFAVASTKEQLPKDEAEAAELNEKAAPLEAEYERRGGWTRYIVVPGGHLHKRACHTLTPGRTMVGQVAEASGFDEGEVVAKYDETACTHCFPDAPVAEKLTPAEEGFCEHSGTYADPETYRTPSGRYAECPCGEVVSVTATGKLRKHKVGG